MKKLTVLYLTGIFTVLLNSIVFSQVKSDTTCYYQAPKITCEQAQSNANAIVKYPIALESIAIKNELIRLKENELYHVKAGFIEERKLFELDKQVLTDSYNKELRRKKRWRFASGVLAIVAGAFYLK